MQKIPHDRRGEPPKHTPRSPGKWLRIWTSGIQWELGSFLHWNDEFLLINVQQTFTSPGIYFNFLQVQRARGASILEQIALSLE